MPSLPAAQGESVVPQVRPAMHAVTHMILMRRLTLLTTALCLCVVVLGAYVRLSNAGLGCPDWPGCYGHLTPTTAALNPGKAWREMAHRYAAGTLAGLIVGIAALGLTRRREQLAPTPHLVALLAAVAVQALLGMLTVTWRLKPLIVTLHLLFGLTTLSLLWWLLLTLWQRRPGPSRAQTQGGGAASRRSAHPARALALVGLSLLALQIALGGWTSSNYAAIACPDFPTCQASWWPRADFHSAFVLWRDLDVNYEGGILAGPARMAIHLAHRFGAAATAVAVLLAVLSGLRAGRSLEVRRAAVAVLVLLALQLSIGIAMVLRGFPLWLATAHNAGAALLLLGMLALNRQLRPALPIATSGPPSLS